MTADLPFRLSAVGDISFEGSEADSPSLECFKRMASSFRQADLVVANLECVLTSIGHDGIPGKCTLRSSPEWAQILRRAGIGLVSLANNHTMDFGSVGLLDTMEALRQADVNFVGAGRNRDEAYAPVFLDIAQRRIAFLARSAVIVSAPTYATENIPGVAFLDVDQTVAAIRACRSRADLVVLLVHWGIEEYSYPSLAQRALAKQLIEAGADLILGHHPHVLQGAEQFGAGMAVYSLGNFVFNEFEWTYLLQDGKKSPQFASLSRDNRNGVIATFEWTGRSAATIKTEFTRIGHRGEAFIDSDPARQVEWKTLCARLSRCCYGTWWRWYAMRREWALRLGDDASLTRVLGNLHRIRTRHIARTFASLLRSFRIVTEKTTNPYE